MRKRVLFFIALMPVVLGNLLTSCGSDSDFEEVDNMIKVVLDGKEYNVDNVFTTSDFMAWLNDGIVVKPGALTMVYLNGEKPSEEKIGEFSSYIGHVDDMFFYPDNKVYYINNGTQSDCFHGEYSVDVEKKEIVMNIYYPNISGNIRTIKWNMVGLSKDMALIDWEVKPGKKYVRYVLLKGGYDFENHPGQVVMYREDN